MLTIALESSELGLLPALFPAIQKTLILSSADLGRIFAVTKLSGILIGPLWLIYARRRGRRPFLVGAAALAGTGAILAGFADGLVPLLLLICGLASLAAASVPIATALLGEVVPDKLRGRAVGAMYAAVSLCGGATGALAGQMLPVRQGWRLAYIALGCCSLAAALTVRFTVAREPPRVTGSTAGHWPRGATLARLLRIRSFILMIVSRLLSGHLVLGAFGIVFLTEIRHVSNAEATLVLPPYGVGLCLGYAFGGVASDWLHARWPTAGRVAFLQVAQFAFAATACAALAIAWNDVASYAALWCSMGLLQGVNPGVNRPIVLAVVPPPLHTPALFLLFSVVEPLGWAAYSLILSQFSAADELRSALLVIMVTIMTVNGAALTPLYRTYRRDAAAAGRNG